MLRPAKREIRMVIGMIPDLVAFRHNPPNESRIMFRIYADEKESRLHVCRFQDVENLRRPFRIGPIIKSDRDLMRAARALMIERRELRESFVYARSDNHPYRPPACAVHPPGFIDRNDFALAHVGNGVGSLQDFEKLTRMRHSS